MSAGRGSGGPSGPPFCLQRRSRRCGEWPCIIRFRRMRIESQIARGARVPMRAAAGVLFALGLGLSSGTPAQTQARPGHGADPGAPVMTMHKTTQLVVVDVVVTGLLGPHRPGPFRLRAARRRSRSAGGALGLAVLALGPRATRAQNQRRAKRCPDRRRSRPAPSLSSTHCAGIPENWSALQYPITYRGAL